VVKKTTFGIGLSPRAALDATGQELCSHWLAAAHAVPQSPFWPRPVSWLQGHAKRLASGAWLSRLTT